MTNEIKRLPIDERTMARLTEAVGYYHGQWKHDCAVNILKQGWISPKQLQHIFSENRKGKSNCHLGQDGGGYEGAPDNAGNGYVTGY